MNNLTQPPIPDKDDVILFLHFQSYLFYILKADFSAGKITFSDKPVILYSINKATKNAWIIEDSAEFKEVKLIEEEHNYTRLIPNTAHNLRVIDSLSNNFDGLNGFSYGLGKDIITLLNELQVINLDKFLRP
jgi:hypothetical protein